MGNIILWLLAIEFLGLITFPVAYLLFKRLPDRGFALSKILGLLLASYLLWVVGLIGIVPTSRLTIIGILLTIALVSCLVLRRRIGFMWAFLWREKLYVFLGEGVFLLIFLMWITIVAQVPGINHTEKLMDFGFLNAIVRSNSFPAEDMWLAGHYITYYHFGHLMMGLLTKLTGVDSNVTYNLSVALIPALVSVAAYGLVYNLIRLTEINRRKAILFALLAPVFVGLIGNMVGVLDFIQARNWGLEGFWQWVNIKDLAQNAGQHSGFFPQDYNWWWHSTRVIDTVVDGKSLDFTITEFPFFSFLLGDLHAHVMALPFMVLSLSLALNLFLSDEPPNFGWLIRHPWELLGMGVSIGALAFINIWDMPVFAGFLVGILFIRSLKDSKHNIILATIRTASVGVPILTLAVLLFLPYYLDLQSQVSGILPLREVSTRPFFFMLVWSLFLVITVSLTVRQLWSVPDIGKKREGLLALTVALTLLPITLWAILIFSVTFLDDGLFDAVATVSARFGKLLPLLLIVGTSLYSTLARAREGPPSLVFILGIVALSFYLLMAVELFYVNDLFNSRMNTVFKIYYQSWLLLAVASAFGVYYWLSQPLPTSHALKLGNYSAISVVAVLLVASFYYPTGAALDRVKSSPVSPTLDGLAFVKERSPGEYDAIEMLRDESPDGRLLEAVGNDYTDYGRVAASTGLASILNWPGHELQWRGSSKPFEGRNEEVATIYQSKDLEKVKALLDKYQIRYVYLGSRERAKYNVEDPATFSQLMKVYFHSSDVIVYERIVP